MKIVASREKRKRLTSVFSTRNERELSSSLAQTNNSALMNLRLWSMDARRELARARANIAAQLGSHGAAVSRHGAKQRIAMRLMSANERHSSGRFLVCSRPSRRSNLNRRRNRVALDQRLSA